MLMQVQMNAGATEAVRTCRPARGAKAPPYRSRNQPHTAKAAASRSSAAVCGAAQRCPNAGSAKRQSLPPPWPRSEWSRSRSSSSNASTAAAISRAGGTVGRCRKGHGSAPAAAEKRREAVRQPYPGLRRQTAQKAPPILHNHGPEIP
jgi:hypothetical protein